MSPATAVFMALVDSEDKVEAEVNNVRVKLDDPQKTTIRKEFNKLVTSEGSDVYELVHCMFIGKIAGQNANCRIDDDFFNDQLDSLFSDFDRVSSIKFYVKGLTESKASKKTVPVTPVESDVTPMDLVTASKGSRKLPFEAVILPNNKKPKVADKPTATPTATSTSTWGNLKARLSLSSLPAPITPGSNMRRVGEVAPAPAPTPAPTRCRTPAPAPTPAPVIRKANGLLLLLPKGTPDTISVVGVQHPLSIFDELAGSNHYLFPDLLKDLIYPLFTFLRQNDKMRNYSCTAHYTVKMSINGQLERVIQIVNSITAKFDFSKAPAPYAAESKTRILSMNAALMTGTTLSYLLSACIYYPLPLRFTPPFCELTQTAPGQLKP